MKYLILILFSFLALLSQAQTSALNEGNELFQDGKYEEAIKKYQSLMHGDDISAELYFNIANAYFQLNNLGKAILYYEKALKIDPKNQIIQNNLSIANQKVNVQISTLPDFFISAYWKSLRDVLPASRWALLSIIFGILALLCAYFWLFSDVLVKKKRAFIALCTLLFLSLLLMALGLSKAKSERHLNQAIVICDVCELRIGPDEISEGIIRLSPGVKMNILDQIGEWYKIELMDREVGWIRGDHIEIY